MSPLALAAGLAPLYAGIPDAARAAQLLEVNRQLIVPVQPSGTAVASHRRRDDPAFEPSRYWRGPVWPMLNWVTYRGLRRYGYEHEAADVRAGMHSSSSSARASGSTTTR